MKSFSLIELHDLIPDEEAVTTWFESRLWPEGRCCGHCGSLHTTEVPHRQPMPYWCSDCRSYFSVRTGTVLSHSKVPLRKWAMAVHAVTNRTKNISSVQLGRDLGVSQQTAWFMLHRLREAWESFEDDDDLFSGPVEADETYFGGRRKNMSLHQRVELNHAEILAKKTVVIGARDRATGRVHAEVIPYVTKNVATRFIESRVDGAAEVFTDESLIYNDLPNERESVNHGAPEYVRGYIHINGIEGFWSEAKRAYVGIHHKLSPKHLNRYVQEFCGRYNMRKKGTLERMSLLVAAMAGRRLTLADLIADNGLPSGARPHT